MTFTVRIRANRSRPMIAEFGDPRLPLRFWAKCIPEPNTGCWLQFLSLDRFGYGRHWPSKRVQRKAHAFAFETLVGPVPEGLELDHKCRVRCCVNPAHIEPVTHRENVLRGLGPMRLIERNRARGAAITHCKHGHEFTAENTFRNRNGHRQCRACMKAYNARRAA